MAEKFYISCLQKQLSGGISREEQSQLDDWLAQSPENQRVAGQVRKAWELSESFGPEVPLDLDADFSNLEKRIRQEAKVVPMGRPWRRFLQVAAALLVLAATPFLVKKFAGPKETFQTFATTDLPSEQVILPDGTRAWLNKATEFSYYTTATPEVRRVKLKGEAYFEVIKNPERPFVVETPAGEVTVLGTTFSVKNADKNDDFAVHVQTGRVQMTHKKGSEKLILEADESGIFETSTGRLRKEINLEMNELAWHTKRLVFDNTSLPEALGMISALYGATIELEADSPLRNCSINASMHGKGISSAKGILETMFGAEMVENGPGRYVLRGGRCR